MVVDGDVMRKLHAIQKHALLILRAGISRNFQGSLRGWMAILIQTYDNVAAESRTSEQRQEGGGVRIGYKQDRSLCDTGIDSLITQHDI